MSSTSTMAGSEPLPQLNSAADQPVSIQCANDINASRRRRKSIALPAELRIGDTGAPALSTTATATSTARLNGTSQTQVRFETAEGAGRAGHGLTQRATPPRQDAKHVGVAVMSNKRSSKRRKARSLLRRARSFAGKHTWVLPLVLLGLLLSLYALNPTESNPMHHFMFLSYPLPAPAPNGRLQYAKGPWDFAFVAFYTVVLSFTREFVMQELIRPLARWCGVRSRGKQARFMEQVYMGLYTGTLGAVGMYVMSRTPVWYFNTRGMYEAYPHRTHEGLVKFYYLFQAAFWAQQAIVLMLGMEARRKDFKELIMHHILSVALIWLSYRFHFTYIGLAVFTTHDISDFFLASSKTMNYLDSPLTAPYFALFIVVWVYMRHYLNLKILWSLLTEFRTVGPYELDWAGQQYKCPLSNVITFALLAALQGLNLFWLFFIVRIAYRIVVHNVAKDDRSDAEDSADEDSSLAEPERASHSHSEPRRLDNKENWVGSKASSSALGQGQSQSHAKLRLRG